MSTEHLCIPVYNIIGMHKHSYFAEKLKNMLSL